MAVSRTTLIASDVHLGAVPEENERGFHAFLDAVPERADELLINGDLFDFWFEYRSVVPRRHFGTLRRLAELVDAGIRVRLVGGNHDAWVGDFLTVEVGVEWLEGERVVQLAGRRAYVAHGDGLGRGDWRYRAFKRLARSSLAEDAFRLVHPDLGAWLARRVSGTPERQAGGPGGEERRAERLAEHAERLLRRDPGLDLVVLGHSHRPELREVEPDRFYLNPGDWIHHCSYAVLGPQGIRLRTWPPG